MPAGHVSCIWGKFLIHVYNKYWFSIRSNELLHLATRSHVAIDKATDPQNTALTWRCATLYSRVNTVMESSLACRLWSNSSKTWLLQRRVRSTREWLPPSATPGTSWHTSVPTTSAKVNQFDQRLCRFIRHTDKLFKSMTNGFIHFVITYRYYKWVYIVWNNCVKIKRPQVSF